MPLHDWTPAVIGIFHSFHHSWVYEICRALNRQLLPDKYYGLIESQELAYNRRKQNCISVRHDVNDRIAARVEIVSPVSNATRSALRSTVDNLSGMLDRGIHVLLVDVLPAHGAGIVHRALWKKLSSSQPKSNSDSLSLASFEAGPTINAYFESISVRQNLPDMPLFLESGVCVSVPLEETYSKAFGAVPVRWRRVLEAASDP